MHKDDHIERAGHLGLGLRGEGGVGETLFEHGFDAFIGTGPDRESSSARGVEPLSPVALAQTHDAQARAEALLGMGTRLQDRFHHSRGGHAAIGRPRDESLRGPLGILLVGFGHVSGHRGMAAFQVRAPVTGHAFALVQQFDHVEGEPHIELLFDQRIGHGGVMALDLDMVIDIDAGAFPLGVYIRVGGQGTQGRVVNGCKQAVSRPWQLLERARVESKQESCNRLIGLPQRKKGVVAKPSENPALHHLHPHFHFGLVSWSQGPGGNDGDAIMVSEFGIGPVEVGLVAVCALDRSLEVVRHDHLRDPTEGFKGAHMGGNPVG